MTVSPSSVREDETVLPLVSITFGGSMTINVVPVTCSSADAKELLALSYRALVSCGCSSPDFGSTADVDAVGAADSFSSAPSPETPSSSAPSDASPLSPDPSCSAVASEDSDPRPSPSEPSSGELEGTSTTATSPPESFSRCWFGPRPTSHENDVGASEERSCRSVVAPRALGRTIVSVAFEVPANTAAAPLTIVGILVALGILLTGWKLSSPSGVLTANSPGVSLETDDVVSAVVTDRDSPESLSAGLTSCSSRVAVVAGCSTDGSVFRRVRSPV